MGVALLAIVFGFGQLGMLRTSTPVAHADSPNLLSNAGFESGRDNWFDFGGSGATTTTNTSHTGSASLVVGPGQQGVGQLITLQPNTYYSISAWGKSSGTEYSQITLRVVDGSNNQVNYQISYTLNDWVRQARTILTPSTVSSALVFVLKNAGTGYFYADDITVSAGRDPEFWPFNANSIWNTPIGSNAVYTPVTLVEQGGTGPDPYQLYWVDAHAPLRQVYTQGSTPANDFGPCNLDPTKGSVGIPQGTMQVPDNFILDNATRVPYSTPNNAGMFIQGDGRTMAELQPVARCDVGGPIFGYRGTDVDLYAEGNGGIHFGSGLSSMGGLLHKGELLGPAPIRHPLQLLFWLEKMASNNPPFRWPADRADGGAPSNYCSLDPCKSNPSAYASVKQGSLLALPPTLTPDSLGIKTVIGQKIFHALQDYGGYVTDDSGWYNEGIGAEDGINDEVQSAYGFSMSTSSSATGAALNWYNDFKSMFTSLQVVDNNSPTSIGGGGTPRVSSPLPDFTASPPPTLKALDRTGWTVNASVNNTDAPKMLDGTLSTYWSTNQPEASGPNFVVDMQTQQTFTRVSLDITANPSNFPQNYEIDVSNDGSSWTEIHAGSGSGTSPTLATFPQQTARYIQVKLTSGSVNPTAAWSVGEFNVFSTTGSTGSSWTKCADENGTCSLTGSMVVRYGANGNYVYQTATGSVPCTNTFFGSDPAPYVVKACYATSVPPTNWTQCASENGTCTVSGTVTVAYGAGTRYAYKTVTNSTPCNNTVFGDPDPGVVKACYFK